MAQKIVKKNKRKITHKACIPKSTCASVPIKLESELPQPKLNRFDYFIAPLFAIIAAIWVYPHVGTSVNWDDLFYMDMSIRTPCSTWVLNRYGHIYLLKFFFFVTRDCITASRVYWCVMFFGTGLLVYWCSKILDGKRSYSAGIIAMILFLVQPLFIVRHWSCPLADFSAMLFVSLGAFIYLAFLDGRHKYRCWAITALGLVFFWALKCKETSICMIVLFLGLGSENSGGFSIKQFTRDIGWACFGWLAGCTILMILDGIFVGDTFFAIRPSNVAMVIDENINRPSTILSRLAQTREVMSWYAGMAKSEWLIALFAPFMLYLLIGWKSVKREFTTREKIVWLIPLGLLLFLTYIRSSFWVMPRYFSPAIPIICVWAAQFFGFDFDGTVLAGTKSRPLAELIAKVGLIMLAFVIVYILMSFIPDIAKFYCFTGRYPTLKMHFKTDDNVLYAVGIVPFVITVLLMTGVFFRKQEFPVLFISFVCLFLMVWQPLRFDFGENGMMATTQKSYWRFLPYKVFADEFQFEKDIKVLISEDVHNQSWMLGNNLDRQQHMFNVFFNKRYSIEHFIHGTWDDILNGDYTYGIVTWRDWEGICKKHDVNHLLASYILKKDMSTRLLLLKNVKLLP